MNLLLDTHVLLWWLDDHPNLGKSARAAIESGANLVFLSAVVVWEIRIKESLGKLEIPPDFKDVLDQQPFEPLPVTSDHAHALSGLPEHHRDPFDRMLVAQALCERLTIVTAGPLIPLYRVPTIAA